MHLILVLIVFCLNLVCVENKSNDIEEKYGDVVIVMSRGRSGSDFISRITENIASAQPMVLAKGLFGQSLHDMEKTKDPMRVIRAYLKEERNRHPKNIIGFKWKPYVWNEEYEHVLRWCGQVGFKILWNHRNPLDEAVSRMRHMTHIDEMVSHCYTISCEEKERTLTTVLDLKETLVFVEERMAADDFIRTKLKEYEVDYLEVTYEEVTYGSDAERLAVLQRINDFAVPKKYRRAVTMKDFDTGTFATTGYHQRNTVENFDEIAAMLRAHNYSDLLHP